MATNIRNELSDTTLEIHELVPGKIEEALINKLVDVGITYIPIPRGEVDFLKIATLMMGAFGNKGPLLSDAGWERRLGIFPSS